MKKFQTATALKKKGLVSGYLLSQYNYLLILNQSDEQ